MADPGQGSGWTVHDLEQRRAWARLSPRERLDWLWQAKEFARRALEARSQRAAAGRSPSAAAADDGADGR
jgi:hypothetical protein